MGPRLTVAIAIAVPVLAGAVLRLRGLGQPSFWLDEVLAYNSASQLLVEPWWAWVIGFAPDHGPFLYATQLIGRVFESPEVSARIVAALFGVLTIPVLWLAVRALGGSVIAAFCASALLAVSPLHVYYSREARPYALSMFFATALMVLLAQRRSLALVIALLVLALYTSGTSAPLLGAVAAVTAVSGVVSPERRRYHWSVAGAAALCFLCIPLLYRGIGGFAAPADVVRVDARIFESALRAFTVSALQTPRAGRTVVALSLLAIIGAIAIMRRNRHAALIAIGVTLLPVVLSLSLMVTFDHWFAVRYLSAALPGFIALAGLGTGSVAAGFSRPIKQWAVALVITTLIATQVLPAALREPFDRLQWREIASAIGRHSRASDVVITAEHWSGITLDFYLSRLPQRIRHVQAPVLDVAQSVVNDHEAAWLVSAGHAHEATVRTWMCRYPIVLAAPRESFRLHYAPSAHHFLKTRSTLEEQRALTFGAGRNPLTLHMGSEDDDLLGEGWWMAEGQGRDAARWAIGAHASAILPQEAPRDRMITIEMQPLTHPTLPEQTARVSLNGAVIGELVLNDPAGRYELAAAKSFWRDGANVLDLRFGRSNAPSQLNGASDQRLLSALVQAISVRDAGSSAQEADVPSVRTIRLASRLSQLPTGYSPADPIAVSTLNREALARLIGRLGFDPVTTLPLLGARRVTLEELAFSLVWSSACEDDITFARRAYAVLLQQVPNAGEETALRAMLRQRSRVKVMEHLLQKREFLDKLQ